MLKSWITAIAVVSGITLCSLTIPQQQNPGFKNLKVLGKKTTHEQLDSTMKSFNRALGVKCNFCHAPSATDPSKLDFASDENKNKDMARSMMRMTARINKKFFKGEEVAAVACFTCHNGQKEPAHAPAQQAPRQ